MPAGGSCLLGAMNLSEYYNDGSFNYDEFGKDVRIAVEFLNQILDEGQPLHPLKEQRDTVTKLRQIGLGFMGLGDLFIKAEVRYGSKESTDLCEHIGSIMIYNALYSSVELAFDNGPFSSCNPDYIINSKFYKNAIMDSDYISINEKDKLTELIKQYGLRNSQLLTCAPTGTISTIFNVSGGIEPIFALKFTRTTKSIYDEDRTYEVYPSGVKYFLDKNGYTSLDEVKEFPDYLVTSRDIDWKGRIDVQAAWQKYIDASISATINLPESATVEDVEQLYIYAHDAGLKGTTVFRENCKRIGILYDSYKKKDENKESQDESIEEDNSTKDLGVESYTGETLEFVKGAVDSNIKSSIKINGVKENSNIGKINIENTVGSKGASYYTNNPTGDINAMIVEKVKSIFAESFRPILTRADFNNSLHGTTYYKRVACGHIYITVNRYMGRPVEVFMQSSKSGGCSANTEALGRMASTMLRAGINPDIVVDSVLGVKCAACSSLKGKGEAIDGLSCSDVMARVIQEEYQNYLDGKYDNEIREWVDSASYEEKWNIIHHDDLQAKVVIDPGYNKNSSNTCVNKDICIHKDKCSDKKRYDGCCGPDDPGEPGEPGESIRFYWNYEEHTDQENIDHYVCPNCGDSLLSSEGCLKCLNCGFSKC